MQAALQHILQTVQRSEVLACPLALITGSNAALYRAASEALAQALQGEALASFSGIIVLMCGCPCKGPPARLWPRPCKVGLCLLLRNDPSRQAAHVAALYKTASKGLALQGGALHPCSNGPPSGLARGCLAAHASGLRGVNVWTLSREKQTGWGAA